MEWCRHEWDAGLGLLADRYGITVRPQAERPNPMGVRDPDYSGAPAAMHGISFKRRILWLETRDAPHAEWLHEVAHLVCTPPWEKGVNDATELAGIFGWERAVAHYFRDKGIWTREDVKTFYGVQDIYLVGDTPTAWGFEGSQSEWGTMRPGHQRIVLGFMYETLRRARLLDDRHRPTLTKPDWTDPSIKVRWKQCENFRTHWRAILAAVRCRKQPHVLPELSGTKRGRGHTPSVGHDRGGHPS